MKLNNDTYVQKAQMVIKALKEEEKNDRRSPMLSTSKIRSILAMTADIYNDVLMGKDEKLSQDVCDRINYLKVRVVYEYGRGDKSVKRFIEQADLLECIDEINGKKSQYLLFSRYMEALVAYHRYYGGKDQ